jgi:hypothetical protein
MSRTRFYRDGYLIEHNEPSTCPMFLAARDKAHAAGFRLYCTGDSDAKYWLARPLSTARLFESDSLDHCLQYVRARDTSGSLKRATSEPLTYPGSTG